MRIDRVDLSLATILGLAALLPSGLTYLGWPAAGYVELVVPALFLLWSVVRYRSGAPDAVRSGVLTWPWDLFVAAMLGAAIYGLMAENRVLSPVFAERLRHSIGELFRPMHQAVHPLYSLRVALTFVEGWLVFRLVVSLCRMAPDPSRRARAAMAGWLAGFALAAIGALAQYVTEFQLHPYWVKANPLLVRTHATLDDPNALGAFLALGIGLLFGLLRLHPARRSLWLALLATGFAALVTTMSRSALGAAILAPMAILAVGPAPTSRFQSWVRLAARVTAGAIVALILASVALRDTMPDQRRTNPVGPVDMVVKTFDPRESTGWVLRGRVPWWQAGAAMFGDHPIVGAGLGRYPRMMGSYGGGPSRENTHNLFLQLLAETGVVGFSGFVLVCGSICVPLARVVRTAHDALARAIALGGLIGIVAFLLTLLTGHTLLLPSGQILWAAFAAAVLSASLPWRPRHDVDPVDGRAARRERRAFVAIGALAIAVMAPTVGSARNVTPRFPSVWGYEAGLHGEERGAANERYRWTSGRAVLDLAVPAGVTSIVVRLAALNPVRNGQPTRVRASVKGTAHELTLATDAVETLRFAVPARTAGSRVILRLDVTPTFVPGEMAGADDRVLGVQLFAPRFEADGVPLPRR
jgi:O-antigen ligase